MLGLGTCLTDGVRFIGPPFSLQLDGTDDFVSIDHHATLKPTAGITVSMWLNLDLYTGATGWINPHLCQNCPNGTAVYQVAIGTVHVGGYALRIEYSGTVNNPETAIHWIVNVSDAGGEGLAEAASGQPDYLVCTWGGITSTTGSNTLHEIKDFSGWVHLVGTYDGGVARLYINGSNDLNDGDVDTSGTQVIDSGVTGKTVRYTQDTKLMIGTDVLFQGGNMIPEPDVFLAGGLIDEVAIWGTVIDADGITKIYNGGKAGLDLTSADGDYDDQGSLVGYWKFEEGTGTSVADSSSNSNTGTLTNSPSWSDWTSE